MAYHKWSGWPGALCLKCGAEDPWEVAIALNWYDPVLEKWDSKEHEETVYKSLYCPIEDKE